MHVTRILWMVRPPPQTPSAACSFTVRNKGAEIGRLFSDPSTSACVLNLIGTFVNCPQVPIYAADSFLVLQVMGPTWPTAAHPLLDASTEDVHCNCRLTLLPTCVGLGLQFASVVSPEADAAGSGSGAEGEALKEHWGNTCLCAMVDIRLQPDYYLLPLRTLAMPTELFFESRAESAEVADCVHVWWLREHARRADDHQRALRGL